MPEEQLEKREGVVDNDHEHTKWVEYWHDGGDKKRKKKWKEEEKQRRRRKRELIEAYEALYEIKPQTAEQLAGPFITAPKSKRAEPTINWEGLIDDIARVEAIYREYREMDDEEVLLLL